MRPDSRPSRLCYTTQGVALAAGSLWWNVVPPYSQGCGCDPQSGHRREATNECRNKCSSTSRSRT